MMKLPLLAAVVLTGCMVSGGTTPPPRGPVVTRTEPRRDPPPPPPRHDHRPDRDHDHGPRPGPRPDPRPQGPRYLEGRMFDAQTRKPLYRGAVDVTSPLIQGEMTVNTDENGYYRTQELPRGGFKIRCRRNGYESINQDTSVTDGPATFDCPMQPKR